MRYNIYVSSYINYSEYRMSNHCRVITDNFNELRMVYGDTRPSKILSKDPDIIAKFRHKVLRRIAEYAEVNNEYRPDDL